MGGTFLQRLKTGVALAYDDLDMRFAIPLLFFSAIANAQTVAPSMLSALEWRSIGPAATGGRIADLAIVKVPGEPLEIYVGTTSGGVFKSSNEGVSFTPVFDHAGGMMSIGAVAVAPSNPSVVWVGTGEADNRQSSSWGDGVYKSIDGGETWQKMGLDETRHVGKIVIHPTDPNTVYVAAVGHLWGSNPERGVFKTTDGGKTWKQGPLQGREHRRHRPGDGSQGSRTSSSPPCISGSARAGASTAAVPAAASIAPPMAAPPGPN